MNLEAIATHLADDGELRLSKGQSLFEGEMPATCDRGVLLLGPYYGAAINHEQRGRIKTEFSVVVRHTNFNDGKKLATDVAAALTVDGERSVAGEIVIQQMLPMNKPRPYRRSAGAYWEFEVEVSIVYIDL